VQFFLGATNDLDSAPPANARLTFTVDYAKSLGNHTRYHDAIGLGPTALPNLERHAANGALAFTSAPLDRDLDVVGAPIVDLRITADARDADVYAYLERIDPDGSIAMLADGVLRASHRVEGAAPYRDLGLPFSDSRRRVVQATPPLSADTPARLRFALMPVSVRFAKGSRVRVVVTGADAGTALSIPQSPPPRVTVHAGAASPSSVSLPVAP
jgi:putative CocE/NonD family hydrolase